MEKKQLTAVAYLEYMWTLRGAIYKEDIDKALKMEEEQMFECIKFGTGVRSVMEEIVHDKISNSLKELVKQGKLKDYRNYKSE